MHLTNLSVPVTRAKLPHQSCKKLRFALTALIDEMVLTSQVSFRIDWMSRPLQLTFFGNNRAGEEFFERMDNIRRAGEAKRTLLEVYFCVFAIGFSRYYKVKGLEQLKALMVDLRGQLEDYTGPVPITLAEHGAPDEGFAMKVGRHVPYWLILTICVCFIVVLFTGFHYVINQGANDSNTHIDKKIEVLTQLDNTGQ